MIERYPDPDDIDRYSRQYGLDREEIVRDIARLATVAQLCETGFLNENCVLVGGMALRLRGSSRFTIYDTDASMRGPLDELELTGALTFETDALEVTPDDGTHWQRRTKLTIASPVDYKAYFASVDPANPIENDFAFTVNQRGLEMRAESLPLVSPYEELVFSRMVRVPVMHITEQAAEKTVGWAAASLIKHYLDLGWIGREHAHEITKDDLTRMVTRKLEVGLEVFPTAYDGLRSLADLLVPLVKPETHVGPLNRDHDTGASRIRFMGEKMSLQEAKAQIRANIIPRLFDLDRPGPAGDGEESS